MESFQVLFSKQAQKDIALLTLKQKEKLRQITEILVVNPYAGKALKGELKGLYSYRLNRIDRIVYEILETEKVIFVIRARTHYGE